MKRHSWLVGVVVALGWLVSGCSTLRVQSGHDAAYDFSRLKTWEWAPHAGSARTDAAATTSERIRLDQLVQEHVRDVLTRKGYPLQVGSADFQVSWSFGEWKLERHSKPGGGYGAVGLMYPGLHASTPHVSEDGRALPPVADPYSSDYEKATIELVIVDRRTQKVIWNASVTDDSDFGYYTSSQRNRIGGAIDKILDGFPPVP